MLQELLPGERACVVHDLARCVRPALKRPDEPPVELAEQVCLIALERRPAPTASGAHDAFPACAVSGRRRVQSVRGPPRTGSKPIRATAPFEAPDSTQERGFLRLPEAPGAPVIPPGPESGRSFNFPLCSAAHRRFVCGPCAVSRRNRCRRPELEQRREAIVAVDWHILQAAGRPQWSIDCCFSSETTVRARELSPLIASRDPRFIEPITPPPRLQCRRPPQ